MTELRIVDSGLRPAREHLAITAALVERHRLGLCPDTVRFLDFPSSAIVGRHQDLRAETNVAWCAENGVALARRITGGGAIVMGPGMLGWEIIAARRLFPADLSEAAERICTAFASALSSFGAQARFRPRNDIEVDGRKVSGTGGYFDGPTLLYQGTLLIDHDPALMANALRPPIEKLERRGIDEIAKRVASLKDFLPDPPEPQDLRAALAQALGAACGLAPIEGALIEEELELARHLHDEEIGTEAFVAGADLPSSPAARRQSVRTPGGVIAIYFKLKSGPERRIAEATIVGDFFIAPPRTIPDLEAALRHIPIDEAAEAVTAFFAGRDVHMLGATPQDILRAFEEIVRSWPSAS